MSERAPALTSTALPCVPADSRGTIRGTVPLQVLERICELLVTPQTESPLIPEISDLFKADRAAHDETAREWTAKYAGIE